MEWLDACSIGAPAALVFNAASRSKATGVLVFMAASVREPCRREQVFDVTRSVAGSLAAKGRTARANR